MSLREFWRRMKALRGRPRNRACGCPGDLRVKAACQTDAGGREENEDRCLVRIPTEDEPSYSQGWLAVVSDGMGGHNAGAEASRLAVDCVVREYYQNPAPPARALRSAFFAANRCILKEASRNQLWSGMGATCTVLVGVGATAFLAHVGDSRLYLLRNGLISQLTEDHSATMDLVRRGLLSASQTRGLEGRNNIVLRALGVDKEVAVTEWDQPLSMLPGDRFILCTDGISNILADEEILSAAADADCEAACRSLMALAAERQAADNVTVVVLDVFAPQDPAPDVQSASPISEVTP